MSAGLGDAADQLIAEGQQRIERILTDTALRIDRILDEIENATGVRPEPLASDRDSILGADWPRLLHHREQALYLLNVVDELEPFMSRGRRAKTVETALKTMPQDVADRVLLGLNGAGLVTLSDGESDD